MFSESFPPGFVSKFKHFKDLRRVTPGSAAITTIMETMAVRSEGGAPPRSTWRDGMSGHGQDAAWKTGGPRAPVGRGPLTGTIVHLLPRTPLVFTREAH